MAIGKCSAYSSLQVDSKGKVCSLAYELAATWCWPTFTQSSRVNSVIWHCTVNDSAVNIVLCFFIVIIIIMYHDHFSAVRFIAFMLGCNWTAYTETCCCVCTSLQSLTLTFFVVASAIWCWHRSLVSTAFDAVPVWCHVAVTHRWHTSSSTVSFCLYSVQRCLFSPAF